MGDKGQQQQQQPSGGHGYDPRRLYPFGLSPIPELPSGLASEVSSVCSYSPTPSDDFADCDSETDEEVRSRSIMYSGSCSSVKEQAEAAATAAATASSDSSDSSTERDTSEDSDDDSDTDVETEDEYTDEEEKQHKNLYSSQVKMPSEPT